jgi:hypothetical protein
LDGGVVQTAQKLFSDTASLRSRVVLAAPIMQHECFFARFEDQALQKQAQTEAASANLF